MNKIIIKTQAELDALPKTFEKLTYIYIESNANNWLRVLLTIPNSRVVAWGNSHVEACENSRVVAWGNSHVVAWGNSRVEAWGNSRVEAWDNSHVVAWGNSHVEAWGNSHVEARDNSHVVAWGNSHVEAFNEVAIYNYSTFTNIEISGHTVLFVIKIAKFLKKEDTVTIINLPARQYSVKEWINREAVNKINGNIILYKRVSFDWKTQENNKNETLWAIGSVVNHPLWSPNEKECGEGKFHACSRGYFCDEFRTKQYDRYIAIEVCESDLFAWPNPVYPHKVAFKTGKVLYECDRYGKEIK